MDGRPDLFVVNGMVTGKNTTRARDRLLEPHVVRVQEVRERVAIADFGDDSLWGRPPKRFYKNLDGRHFDELAAVTGLESDANQRGLVVVDVNGDGAPDLFATGFLQRAVALDQPQSRRTRRRSSSRSRATRACRAPSSSTRDALGASSPSRSAASSRAQVVSAGYSFLSSGPKELYFGLGDAREGGPRRRFAGPRAASPSAATSPPAGSTCASPRPDG